MLKDSHGKDTRLSAYSGRPIVLCFLKRDTNRLDNLALLRLRDHHGKLAAMGATVVGVSLGSVQTHADWRHKHEVPFHLLSDPEGRVHDLYDAWRTTLFGRSPIAVRRCTFVIDNAGLIRAVHRNVNVFTHAKAVLKDLERLAAQKSWGQGRKVAEPPSP